MRQEKNMANSTIALEQLEERIGYVFADKKLLRQALTHSSYANEQKINKFLTILYVVKKYLL